MDVAQIITLVCMIGALIFGGIHAMVSFMEFAIRMEDRKRQKLISDMRRTDHKRQ